LAHLATSRVSLIIAQFSVTPRKKVEEQPPQRSQRRGKTWLLSVISVPSVVNSLLLGVTRRPRR
jgi:hypothetical protein